MIDNHAYLVRWFFIECEISIWQLGEIFLNFSCMKITNEALKLSMWKVVGRLAVIMLTFFVWNVAANWGYNGDSTLRDKLINTIYLSEYLTNWMQKNLFHSKFYFMPLHVSSTCAHHQEVKIALHSIWYHHTYGWPSRARVERGLLSQLRILEAWSDIKDIAKCYDVLLTL